MTEFQQSCGWNYYTHPTFK